MRHFILSLILIATVSHHLAAHAGLCKAQMQKAPSGEERIGSIHFPDGRRITVIGHNHGFRQLELLALKPNPEYIDQMREIVESEQEAVRHFREDLGLIRKEIQSGAKFIGIEEAHSEVANRTASIKNFQFRTHRNFEQLKAHNASLRTAANLLVAGPAQYLELTEPGVVRGIPILGIEDNAAFEAGYFEIADDAQLVLLKAMQNSPDSHFMARFANIKRALYYRIYGNYSPEQDEEITAEVLTLTPQNLRPAMENWLKKVLKSFVLVKERDRHIVDNVLNLNQSGVILMGECHLPSLLRMFEARCHLGGTTAPQESPPVAR